MPQYHVCPHCGQTITPEDLTVFTNRTFLKSLPERWGLRSAKIRAMGALNQRAADEFWSALQQASCLGGVILAFHEILVAGMPDIDRIRNSRLFLDGLSAAATSALGDYQSQCEKTIGLCLGITPEECYS